MVIPFTFAVVVVQLPALVAVSPVSAGSPVQGTDVAVIVPLPLVPSDPPVPTTRAFALVPLETPLNGVAVEVMVPEPEAAILAPVPTTIAAEVLVALVIALNAAPTPLPTKTQVSVDVQAYNPTVAEVLKNTSPPVALQVAGRVEPCRTMVDVPPWARRGGLDARSIPKRTRNARLIAADNLPV